MELRASGEDYLEAVLIMGHRVGQVRAIDVAQYLGYAKTSVSHGLRLLREGGFLTRDQDGFLYLTDIGRETAEKIYAKHRFFYPVAHQGGCFTRHRRKRCLPYGTRRQRRELSQTDGGAGTCSGRT